MARSHVKFHDAMDMEKFSDAFFKSFSSWLIVERVFCALALLYVVGDETDH